MEYPTYGTMRTKVLQDMDIEDEVFIDTDTELLGLFNEAVDFVESQIHGIAEDYFKTDAYLVMTLDSANVSLPSDIYASKVRGLVYENQTLRYDVLRFKNPQTAHIEISLRNQPTRSTEWYKYWLKNASADAGVLIQLSPVSRESSTDHLHCWYIRNARSFTGVTTEKCDIPEFSDVVVEYVKWKVKCKELNQPDFPMTPALVTKIENMMVTLKDMVPDGDCEIPPDFSFYWEHN